ncbi:MAG: magnesium chelatase family protein [Patescibacteria group bacterium]|nr:magnesium chelatase family protein [Patescibacteria group bacterium]
MSFSRIQSAQLSGLGATGVIVEVDISRGLYLFQIVGLPDKAVEESRERVISALRNSLDINPKSQNEKVIVSLSPAELKKEGAYFDLAIALGYLSSTGMIKGETDGKIFLGELSLNGEVKPIRGLLSIAKWAKEEGYTEVFIPKDNEIEATLIDGITFYLVSNISDLVLHINGGQTLPKSTFVPFTHKEETFELDFGDVRGQRAAKRALTIAAAGGHNIVLYGPPGTGKTMLAKAFHGILPVPQNEHFLEVATIYSSVGLIESVMKNPVPLRSPHHSASHVAIIGGGQGQIRPGDITLAHRGVLYMDEFPEFDRRVLEALREPLEEGAITVARAKGSVRFPAEFILLGAMNPCPCGYRGSGIKPCTCSGMELARYNKKLSGTIVDRIDIWVPVAHVQYETLHEKRTEKESDGLRKLISDIQSIQYKRNNKLNKNLSSSEVQEGSNISEKAKETLQRFAEKIQLSPRVYLRTIKVARTIADLEGSDTIEEPHILEALQYRPKFE